MITKIMRKNNFEYLIFYSLTIMLFDYYTVKCKPKLKN